MPNPHQREVAVFEAALQLPPEQRESYLDQTCGDDLELRDRIRGLLRAHQDQTDLLEPSVRAAFGRDALPAEKPGDQIGPYKLLQQIGEGGCGSVYMAEQAEPIQRRVALKIIKLGMDTRQVVARFDAERHALALMEHPNIARVLDAGATETGRPYFVMELVRGLKITDYCDQNHLSTQERLELFILVCHAVQHAHQKGIIHRDLKPSNILVTVNDGLAVPKVIDFGIAKATQGRLTDQTVFTAFEQFIGTPAYMSPEQTAMTSVDIDTRSDIYSLGVLLYELLTGKTPFDTRTLLAAGLDQMRRTICETEPARPSTRLSTLGEEELTTAAERRKAQPPELVHLVRDDLDWIVMKCLEKDRARRYETANGLAMDIQRHLSCEPVSARPPSKFYEFQKAVRRHKFGFGATAALMLVLAAGVMVSTREAIRARRAEREQIRLRELERQEAAKSRKVSQFLKDYTRGEMERLGEGVATNFAEARKWYQEGADAGHARSMYMLGEMEFLGEGTAIDFTQAMNWFRKAAESGDPSASVRLGEMYELGDGMPKNLVEAVKWYRKAAEAGSNWGRWHLGLMYENGEGVPKDPAEAARLYRMSADQGAHDGARLLGELYRRGVGVLQDSAEAVKWYRKAAAEGDQNVFITLGLMYLHGDGVPANRTEAQKWFLKAAEEHHGAAAQLYQLGVMYLHGDGVPINFAEARKWFLAAAEQHDSESEYYLGVMWQHGDGVARNAGEAAKWFRQAADEGNQDASVTLGLTYLRGDGVPTNVVEAQKWILRAAEQHGLYPPPGGVEWTEAREAYTAAIRLKPDNVEAWAARGDCDLHIGDFSGMAKDYSEAIRLKPDGHWYWHERAYAYQALGELKKAIADHSKCIELNDSDADERWRRGHAYETLGDLPHAAADYSRAIALNPDHWPYWEDLDRVDSSQHGSDKARADLAEAAKQVRKAADEGDSDGFVTLGLIYLHGEGVPTNAVEAHKWFLKAAEQHQLHLPSGLKWTEARDICSEVIRQMPDSVEAWAERGACDYHLDDFSNMARDYSEAIRLKPDMQGYWHERAYAYQALGELRKAISDHSKCIEMNDNDAGERGRRGRAYEDLGDFPDAAADYSRGIALNRGDWQLWDDLARIDSDKARADLAQAVKLCSTNETPSDQDSLAWMLAANGDPRLRDGSAAVGLAQKAVASTSRANRAFLGTLAVAYAEVGQFTNAVKTEKEALRSEANADKINLRTFRLKLFESGKRYHDPMSLNNTAWSLATSPLAKARNGKLAVALAEEALSLTSRTNAMFLDTLAAADAETGDFANAVALEQESIGLLTDKLEIADYTKRLKLYEGNKPCREP